MIDSPSKDELPAYDGSVSRHGSKPEYPTNHSFVHVFSGKDTCTITIHSRAAYHDSPPMFYPGDTVSGVVELTLAHKMSLKAVEVKVSA